ncbi:ubiquitin-like domain-containing protein, partial [Enterococcus sp.]|uniref:ubiquitin-like domain-containing protein n=1 Tax=Enterococcus sp. TaxID=35783 RepID=UPI00289E7605
MGNYVSHLITCSRNKITIEKAFGVKLLDGGEVKKVWSTSTTVADFLTQHEISLAKLDRVEP